MLVFSLGVLSQYFLVFLVYMLLSVHLVANGTFHLFWLVCFTFIPFLDILGYYGYFCYAILVCLINFIHLFSILSHMSSYMHFLSKSSYIPQYNNFGTIFFFFGKYPEWFILLFVSPLLKYLKCL